LSRDVDNWRGDCESAQAGKEDRVLHLVVFGGFLFVAGFFDDSRLIGEMSESDSDGDFIVCGLERIGEEI